MIQKHYLADEAAFKRISSDWPAGTPEPPEYPCIAVWGWYNGFSRDWVQVEYVFADDFVDIA